MKIDISKLKTASNFAKEKGLSRSHVYRLAEIGELTMVHIDGVKFIVLDVKAENFQRKRNPKSS